MSMIAPYPHVQIDVEDKSIYVPVTQDFLPLHRPLYIMRTQKGPIGVPVWCPTYNDAVKTFGADTFNKRSKYFSPSAYFLLKQFQSNGAFIMRAAADDCNEARIYVELGVEETTIKLWKRDEYGRFVLDANNAKIPVNAAGEDIDSTGTQATVNGISLTWRAKVTSADTTSTSNADKQPTTVGDITWYPMYTVVTSNGGAWGNSFGFKLFYDQTANAGDFISRNGGVAYSVAPVQLLNGTNVATAIFDKYNNPAIQAVMQPDAVDSITGVAISLKDKMEAGYSDGYELPCQFTYYSENFNTVGKLVMKAELDAATTLQTVYGSSSTFVDKLVDGITAEDINAEDSNYGFMANLMSAIDSERCAYFATEVVAKDNAEVGSIDMDADSVVYLLGGTDGDISDPAIETYTQLYLDAAARNAQEYLIDYARCPFNCIIDTGVGIATKKAYLSFMDVRDDLKVYLGTQISWYQNTGTDVAPKLTLPQINDRYTDESLGGSLRTHAWLMRESVAKGTEACRATIMLHAMHVSDWDRALPATLWIAEKLASYCNRDFMDQEPKELPNSAVECCKSLSWTAAAEDTRSRCWNAGLNYVQYYSMNGLHYASVRSVYKYDTSVLVDDMFVNAITWMKHIVRVSWAKFAGSTRPVAALQKDITDDLTSRIAYMINGKYEFKVNVYQTDEDKKLGYVQHVDIEVTSPAQNRVWLVGIICKREGYEVE